MYTFVPRRPVKSFQDLEVYQKLLAVSVAVAKHIAPLPILPKVDSKSLPKAAATTAAADVTEITSKLTRTALSLPVLIATAHSLRFSDQVKAIATLEDVMLGCNLLIVYLEQYRDIENKDIENEFFEEQIRILLATRFKVMHLQMSWKKFMKETP